MKHDHDIKIETYSLPMVETQIATTARLPKETAK